MRALTDAERSALADVCAGLEPDRVRLHRTPGSLLRGLVLFLSRGRAVTLGRHRTSGDDQRQRGEIRGRHPV